LGHLDRNTKANSKKRPRPCASPNDGIGDHAKDAAGQPPTQQPEFIAGGEMPRVDSNDVSCSVETVAENEPSNLVRLGAEAIAISSTAPEGTCDDNDDALADALFNADDSDDVNGGKISGSSSSRGSNICDVPDNIMTKGKADIIAVLEKLQASLLDPSWFKRHGASLG